VNLRKRITKLEAEAGRRPEARLIVRRIVGRFEDRPECYRIHGRLIGASRALELHRDDGEPEAAFLERAARELKRYEGDPAGYVAPIAVNPLLPSDSEPLISDSAQRLELESSDPVTTPAPIENAPESVPEEPEPAPKPADAMPWRSGGLRGTPADSRNEGKRTSATIIREMEQLIERLR
jgi:hypothetical protein